MADAAGLAVAEHKLVVVAFVEGEGVDGFGRFHLCEGNDFLVLLFGDKKCKILRPRAGADLQSVPLPNILLVN